MNDGSTWRIAAILAFLAIPLAAAAPPAPIQNAVTSTDAQPITDLALEPTGQFAMAVVEVDVPTAGGLLGGVTGNTKSDVYLCDYSSARFLTPKTPTQSGQSCKGYRHTTEPTQTTPRLTQAVAVTSYELAGTGLTARYAVGGPGNKVTYWHNAAQAPQWEIAVGPGEPVLNVSITPNAKRIVAATDAPINGGSRLYVIDTAAQSDRVLWAYNLTDADSVSTNVRVRAMEHPIGGKYLVVGTTPRQGSSDGAVLWLDVQANDAPSSRPAARPVLGAVTALDVSDNGNALVVGTTSSLYYFELVNGLPDAQRLPWSGTPSAAGASVVAMAGNGERFAAASGDTIHFYRRTGTSSIAEEIGTGYPTGAPVADIAYSRTGGLLVAVAGSKVFGFAPNRTEPIWSFDTKESAYGSLDFPLREVETSANGDRIVVASRTKVQPYALRIGASITSLKPDREEVQPASTYRTSLVVKNTGSIEDELVLVPTGPVSWPAPRLSATRVALLPEETARVELELDVPAGQRDGEYPLDVVVQSARLLNMSDNQQLGNVHAQLVVPRSVQLTIEPSEERFSIIKGGEKTIAVTIRNVGNAGGLVNLTVGQETSSGSTWTATLDDEQIELGAGNEQTVNLFLRAPETGVSGDANTITVYAREGSYEARRSVRGYIDAVFGATLTASNETLEFSTRAAQTIRVTLRNTGNIDDRYNLTTEITGGSRTDWKAQLSSQVIDVPRGQSRDVVITVEPLQAEPAAATLRVRAVSQGSLQGDEATTGISLIHKAAPPEEEKDSLIPAPPVGIVLVLFAAVALARRLRGGRA